MSYRNALKELEAHLEAHWKSFQDIKYCWFTNVDDYQSYYEKPDGILMVRNEEDSLNKVVNWLRNYDYDSWYWWQELFWEVVFNDGTWLERWEYDGSEWWEYKKTPECPPIEYIIELKKNYKETNE